MKVFVTFLILLVSIIFLFLVGTVVFILNSIRIIYRRDSLLEYFLSIIESIDQLGGTIIFQTLDFTISSNLYRKHETSLVNRWAMNFIDFLARYISKGLYKIRFISLREYERQKTHCESAYRKELEEFRLYQQKNKVQKKEHSCHKVFKFYP